MIATYDKGQAPQQGGWLHGDARQGHYTYFAYAFHRQLPYGVPGAYRITANLLALGKRPPGCWLSHLPRGNARRSARRLGRLFRAARRRS